MEVGIACDARLGPQLPSRSLHVILHQKGTCKNEEHLLGMHKAYALLIVIKLCIGERRKKTKKQGEQNRLFTLVILNLYMG